MEKAAEEEGGFWNKEEDGYDAVVVGSGYGGSVAACRMSMAGIKVCLVEKGQRWEAKDFPTNSLKIMSAVRIESKNLGVSFGPKDALFQVYEQDDSLAAVACGLGGGSLVNAGVMIPTPIRARRNSKWPKEWEKDWEICEASASAMLGIQSVPQKFPIAKTMEGISGREIEESFQNSIKLSMNFRHEEQQLDSMKPRQMASCLACGNCLSGCPYDAKNSTDKNYIDLAVQAGCTVKTGCQVLFVAKSTDEICKEEGRICTKTRRRWLVFFNETDYVPSDSVILSAGVFGTTEILFQSQLRGLRLSARLGAGFSCNGNNVAYVAGSSAPLGAYGLGRRQLSKIPIQERPGPSISSSYTSSLGFTIQGAVLPKAFPNFLFKGIMTYGWPPGYWFLHGIIDKIKHILGLKYSQAMALNAMGYDESDGKITFEKETNKICFDPPYDPLLPRKIEAFQKLTKKLGGVLFMSRYRSTSVHLLGGCNASSHPSNGVCNPNGQVFDTQFPTSVHPGLYVCDASLIPCSVGVNPCLTIATAAEHVSHHLVQDILKCKTGEGIECLGEPVERKTNLIRWELDSRMKPSIVIKETMRGYVGGMPCSAHLKMKMNCLKLNAFDKPCQVKDESHQLLRGKVGGYVVFRSVEKDKLYVIDGDVDLCGVDSRTPYTQYMRYCLLLSASSGSRYILEGRKTMNPYLFALYAWKESTTMQITFKKVAKNSSTDQMMILSGELHISMTGLLKSVISLEGNRKGKFICLLLQSLFRTYIIQVPRVFHKGFPPFDPHQQAYPDSMLHNTKTGDGFIISCRQWKCSQYPWVLEEERKRNPVLLLNGHSTESYHLPTEPNDLIRTLLEEGHDIWLLQTRLHPSNPSNNFTIEDVGRFDIPAAILKILELHGPSVKIHLVAHCVGGLAVHIALMGGYVSANHIASLSCTNSAMFFKITVSSRVKMCLPLIPISMLILGKNKILPIFETLKATPRHRLLKSIARLIPRYERCTCDECEVFSGIFGNTFWHENVSPSMHHWLNKESLLRLPMAAFPHLRKICNNGFVVDHNGKNSYLVHPERMALPTLYISGGRSLLVTPQTSFLANKYMMLHQPGFRHERVVVEGFGHSDLLIGEESYNKVFPHILSHMRLAEDGRRNSRVSAEGLNCSRGAFDWGDDPCEAGSVRFSIWVSPSTVFWLFLALSIILLFSLYT